MNLPEGTVTFLFTDIEGSTALWEAHPEAMQRALPRHDALLREAIQGAGGSVFKTMGDAFYAVFADAPSALQASLDAQSALNAESWPESVAIQVRMALYTGEVISRDNDYFGQPLNRAARLLSTGHGGQILVSQTTYSLIQSALPGEVSLRELGEHYLRDLLHPEPIFQLCSPELPREFPPLRSLNKIIRPNNLPAPMTSFIGREKELAEIKMLLERSRHLTLTGAGGCGKTRLAIQLATECLEAYQDGVWFVELAALANPALLPQQVASACGIKDTSGQPILEVLLAQLKDKKLLLILDNCEHLLVDCASLVERVLSQCPHVVLLATSREGLGSAQELTYRIPSLSLPSTAQDQTPESLSHYEASRLFIERAVQIKTTFTVRTQEVSALASICQRLDGIPLALELAAARTRSLSVGEINQLLDQRFRLLTGGSRTVLPRQQTLRSLIDWSYDLLNPMEKALFCRLSVFVGGWTLEAAERICSGQAPSISQLGGNIEDWEILDLLTSLCDKSLIVVEEHNGETRYRLLETMRQYSRDHLLERGESEWWRNQHLLYFMRFVEEADLHLSGAEQQQWQDRLEREHDNFRGALTWACEGSGGPESALRLCGVLWRFWFVRGYLGEGYAWCQLALERGRELGRTRELARVLNGAGVLARNQGDFAAARSLYEEALVIYQELGNRSGIAAVLSSLAGVTYRQHDMDSARSLYEESLRIQRELGDLHGIAIALNGLGNVALSQRELTLARSLQEEGLALQRQLGNRHGVAYSLSNLSKVALEQGDYVLAGALQKESLLIRCALGDRQGAAVSLEALARVASALVVPLLAARLWGAVEHLREQLGAPLSPTEREKYLEQVGAARATLADDTAFDAAWQEGRALTLDQARELASTLSDP